MDVGVVLSRYDEDNNYAVFGFGGQPGKLNLSKSQKKSQLRMLLLKKSQLRMLLLKKSQLRMLLLKKNK